METEKQSFKAEPKSEDERIQMKYNDLELDLINSSGWPMAEWIKDNADDY